jgi:Prion-inhibition and propagation
MADPLSITVSIIAVADFALEILGVVKAKVLSMQNATKNAHHINQTLDSLDLVLNATKDLFSRFESIQNQQSTARSVTWAAQKLQACKDELRSLHTILAEADASSTSRIAGKLSKRLKWAFGNEEKAAKAVDRLQGYKHDLHYFLSYIGR